MEPSTTDWPGSLGPRTNTGSIGADAAPVGDPARDWGVPAETHVGHHVPVVRDGVVYAHDKDDELSAFDAATGRRSWPMDVTEPVTAPAVSGDTLVLATREDLRAIDATTREVQWRRENEGSWFDASPVLANDTVYLQRGVATHAFALADGSQRWRTPTGLPSESTPAVTENTVYTAGRDTYVRALDASDGTERWRVKTDARIQCNVSVVDDTVLAANTAGTILAIDAQTGTVRWRYRLASRDPDGGGPRERPETLATDGSRAYVATDDQLLALALADGSRCWRARSYNSSYASGVAVAGGTVYAPTEGSGGHLTAFDAATGDSTQQVEDDRLARVRVGPSLADGALYIAGGNVVARLS